MFASCCQSCGTEQSPSSFTNGRQFLSLKTEPKTEPDCIHAEINESRPSVNLLTVVKEEPVEFDPVTCVQQDDRDHPKTDQFPPCHLHATCKLEICPNLTSPSARTSPSTKSTEKIPKLSSSSARFQPQDEQNCCQFSPSDNAGPESCYCHCNVKKELTTTSAFLPFREQTLPNNDDRFIVRPDVVGPVGETPFKLVPKSFQCMFCRKKFHSLAGLSGHQRIVHDSDFRCSFCSKKFGSSESLSKHLQKGHQEVQSLPLSLCLFSCSLCSRKFDSQQVLQVHVTKCHPEREFKEFSCRFCGKNFTASTAMFYHQRTQHKQEMRDCGDFFTCSQCGQDDFHSWRSLSIHIKRKHNQTNTSSKDVETITTSN